MSGHEHERLSAYLDGELTPAARAAVAAHLEACGECRERLAELRAVSEAASALPSEAPPGYFEALPGRVRARLEPRGSRRARSVPAWTWAAAAALLLAVVTPLTLQRRSAPSAPRPESPASETTVAAPPARASEGARDDSGAPPQELVKLSQATGRAAPAATPAKAPRAPAKREEAFARSPSEADTRTREAEAAAPASLPPAATQAVAAAPQPGVLADAGAASGAAMPQARNQATAFEEKLAEKRAADRSREERDEAERPAPAEPQAADALASRGRASAAPLGAAAVASGDQPSSRQAEWGRLDAAEPRTAAEWRRLREGWLAFVARDPVGPRADAARVRGIEAALAAWRASLDPADEALFRRDAAAYLERTDARQKEHVRRLLEPGPP